jgi:hypothetical protein
MYNNTLPSNDNDALINLVIFEDYNERDDIAWLYLMSEAGYG